MHVIGITGASGPIIGIRLIEELLRAGREVAAIVSASGWKIIGHEMAGGKESFGSVAEILRRRGSGITSEKLREYSDDDFFSPVASGTSRFESVVVAPCSMKTLGAVAGGYADTLIRRAVDVALKEKRRCVLVPRETPLSVIHLENMLKAARAGADILPPVPGFYTFPRSVDDVVDFVVGKILSLLDIEHALFRRWGE